MIKAFKIANVIVSILWVISLIYLLLGLMYYMDRPLLLAMKGLLYPIMILIVLSLMNLIVKELILRYNEIEKTMEHFKDGE